MSSGMRLEYERNFDSAHCIVGHKGKCANVHGHTWRVKFKINMKVPVEEISIDFGDLKEVVDSLDHKFLNEVLKGKNPTAELLAKYLTEKVIELDSGNIRDIETTLWESKHSSITYTKDLSM